jgi:hypothetical protein
LMNSQQEQLHHRHLYHPNTHASSNYNQPPQVRSSRNNKPVRMGSMVFANLVKREEGASHTIRESRSIDRVLRTERSEPFPIECVNADG